MSNPWCSEAKPGEAEPAPPNLEPRRGRYFSLVCKEEVTAVFHAKFLVQP